MKFVMLLLMITALTHVPAALRGWAPGIALPVVAPPPQLEAHWFAGGAPTEPDDALNYYLYENFANHPVLTALPSLPKSLMVEGTAKANWGAGPSAWIHNATMYRTHGDSHIGNQLGRFLYQLEAPWETNAWEKATTSLGAHKDFLPRIYLSASMDLGTSAGRTANFVPPRVISVGGIRVAGFGRVAAENSSAHGSNPDINDTVGWHQGTSGSLSHPYTGHPALLLLWRPGTGGMYGTILLKGHSYIVGGLGNSYGPEGNGYYDFFRKLANTGDAGDGNWVNDEYPWDYAFLPQAVLNHWVVTDGHYLYYGGGRHDSNPLVYNLEVWRFDPDEGVWEQMTSLPSAVDLAPAVWYEPTNTIYVFHGATVYAYDVSQGLGGSWANLSGTVNPSSYSINGFTRSASPYISVTPFDITQDWSHHTPISILSSQIDADLPEMELYIDLSDMPAGFWSTVKSDGSDIRVFLSDDTTRLPHSLANWNYGAETGALYTRVKRGVSSSVNTTVHVHYGNASAKTVGQYDLHGSRAVFEKYWIVAHNGLDDVCGVETTRPPTNNGTTLGAGKTAGGSRVFNGSSDSINWGDAFANPPNADRQFGFWFKTIQAGAVALVTRDDPTALLRSFTAELNASGEAMCGFYDNDVFYGVTDTGTDLRDGAWHHIYWHNSTRTGFDYVKLWVDGALVGTTGTINFADFESIPDTLIGRRHGAPIDYLSGELGELWMGRNDTLPVINDAYVAALYRNQNNPGAFYSVGAHTAN